MFLGKNFSCVIFIYIFLCQKGLLAFGIQIPDIYRKFGKSLAFVNFGENGENGENQY
jgi:hypothetical protein